jgi:signal transduction histidine kinase
VEDDGQGISQADVPHIFDKFYRARSSSSGATSDTGLPADTGTAAPGAGLGLYLARHIVNQLDGKITVERKEGGTIFTVFLPLWIDTKNSEANTEEKADVEAIISS